MIISNKRVGTDLYASGFFGNRLRQFNTVAEARAADPQPYRLMLRQRKKGGGGVSVHSISLENADDVINSYSHETDLYFSEQIVNQPENILFQGEYMHGNDGEYLWFSCAKAFHRDAMRAGRGYGGAGCRLILQQFLDLPSYENLMNLADCFPDHAIEFTTCSEPIGCLGLNTIIWEVRKY